VTNHYGFKNGSCKIEEIFEKRKEGRHAWIDFCRFLHDNLVELRGSVDVEWLLSLAYLGSGNRFCRSSYRLYLFDEFIGF
jgi:hypothetical protein